MLSAAKCARHPSYTDLDRWLKRRRFAVSEQPAGSPLPGYGPGPAGTELHGALGVVVPHRSVPDSRSGTCRRDGNKSKKRDHRGLMEFMEMSRAMTT